MRTFKVLPLLLALICLLTGCRTRLGDTDAGNTAGAGGTGVNEASAIASEGDGAGDHSDESADITRESPEAERREFDESADAEAIEGLERTASGAGEGHGATANDEVDRLASLLDSDAELTVSERVSDENAARASANDLSERSDGALAYYTALLNDRAGTLFECKRLNVYWETAEPRTTVYKTSAEHDIIIAAGCYDVSARLLEENLTVDDSWIARKDPNVIAKVVSKETLGQGALSTAAAQSTRQSILSRAELSAVDAVKQGRVVILSQQLLGNEYMRTAAALILAQTAHPELFEDVSLDEAISLLYEEATGQAAEGVWWLS